MNIFDEIDTTTRTYRVAMGLPAEPEHRCPGRHGRCDSIVDNDGDLCGGCRAALDNAIDHLEFPDRVMP